MSHEPLKNAYAAVIVEATSAEITAGDCDNLPGSVWVLNKTTNTIAQGNPSGSPSQVSTTATVLKDNLAASVAPAVSNDANGGYAVGSRWIDTVADESYICVDATIGAAVWSRTTVGTIGEVAGLQAALDAKATTTSLTAHTGSTSNPHSVTKTQVGLGNADNTTDANKPVSTATQTALNLKADSSTLTAHTGNTSNPHSTTKAQVGLSNVDNTTDANKPVSTATQTALNLKADSSSLTAHTGSTSNPHSVTKAQVGLGNVDNTTDANKPVSSATQTALNAKQDLLTSGTNIRTVNGQSLVGSGDVPVALPGATTQTITDEGLVAGTATIDRTTVPGQTILRYATAGTTSFTPPVGIPSNQVRVLVVGSGGGGGTGTYTSGTVLGGGGGGAGGAGGAPTAGAGVANDITGASVTYAAGGAGSPNNAGGNVGANGAGGTGNGGGGAFAGGSDGLASGNATGGAGGLGVVIVRFPTQTRSYSGLAAYSSDATAAVGGILVGQFYRSSTSGAVVQRVT